MSGGEEVVDREVELEGPAPDLAHEELGGAVVGDGDSDNSRGAEDVPPGSASGKKGGRDKERQRTPALTPPPVLT